jgi:hypothetical protein
MKLKLYRPAENGGCWGIVLAIGTWLNIDIAIAAPRVVGSRAGHLKEKLERVTSDEMKGTISRDIGS